MNNFTGCVQIVRRALSFDSTRKAVCSTFKTATFLSILFAVFFNAQTVFGQTDGTLDASFAPVVTARTASISALAAQPDGKILIGGFFVKVNGVNRVNLIRLNTDGTSDTSFNSGTGVNDRITSLVLQPDGKILIGGFFNDYNGTIRRGIARLNANGTLDTTFVPGAGVSGSIEQIILQTDGKIMVVGVVQTGSISSSAANVARLNPDGSVDSTFNFVRNSQSFLSILKIGLQPDGKVLVSTSNFASTPPSSLVRLNLNGSVDSSFNLGAEVNFPVLQIAVQPNGKIVIGGSLSSNSGANTQAAARINPDGSFDVQLTIPLQTPSSQITVVKIQPDGKILIGGVYAGGAANIFRLFRFNADGSIDSSFQTGELDGNAAAIELTTDNRILVGGAFTGYNNFTQTNLVQLNGSGAVDNSFAPFFEGLGSISKIAVQPDGKLLVGGTFTQINGITKSRLVRFNADGSLDNSFNADANLDFTPNEILIQSNNKIIIGGFISSNGFSGFNKIARLNADGSLDNTFASPLSATSTIFDVALQPDDKILVGGVLSLVNSLTQRKIIRLNADGSRDASFNSNGSDADDAVQSIALLPDGKIVITGSFQSYNGVQSPRIARLLADGTLDASFTSRFTTDNFVQKAFALTNGKILVSGSRLTADFRVNLIRLNADGSTDKTFTSSVQFGNIIDLVVQTNGKIILGGTFGSETINGSDTRTNVVRLNSDGSADTAFVNGRVTGGPVVARSGVSFIGVGAANPVSSLALLSNGKIAVGGSFAFYNNAPRFSIAVLNNTIRTPTTLFDFDGDKRADLSVFRPSNGVWYVSQSTNNQTRVAQFGQAGDAVTPADFDGDGKADLAIFRNGMWYRLNSSNNSFVSFQFGQTGDLAVPGDFDGDGKADYTVFRPSNGVWYRTNSSNNQFVSVQFGQNGDAPLSGDFDGDGRNDTAVFRPSNGTWYRTDSSNNSFVSVQFGQTGDNAVPADFDGDGITDIAVFRASNGVWYRYNPANGGNFNFQFGQNGDVPAPADYDGDGKADFAVYRNGTWYLNNSTSGFAAVNFGLPDDKVVPAAFVR